LHASVRHTAVAETEADSESTDGPACFNEVPGTSNQRVDFFA